MTEEDLNTKGETLSEDEKERAGKLCETLYKVIETETDPNVVQAALGTVQVAFVANQVQGNEELGLRALDLFIEHFKTGLKAACADVREWRARNHENNGSVN